MNILYNQTKAHHYGIYCNYFAILLWYNQIQHFGVIRLHGTNDYDYQTHGISNNLLFHKLITYLNMN